MPEKNRDEIFLEYEVLTTPRWALRVHSSGRVDEFSDLEMTFERGEVLSHQVPAKWRHLVDLSHKQMQQLLDTIHESGFFDLPVSLDSDRVNDGITTHWTIKLDGKEHEVTERVAGEEHPALKKLAAVLNDLTGETLEGQ